jgi:putative peptidoglycan lipid II flippase
MLLAVSAVVALVVLVASPLAGMALVPNGEQEAQDTAAVSVAILALAAYCQVWSAMLSAVLGAVRRFVSSALFYLLSSAVAVALGAGLMAGVGIEGAAIGALGAAVVLLAAHLVYTRRLQFAALPEWRSLRGSEAWRLAATALAGASVPVVLQITATISLAAVSGRTGAVTAYSYAYFVTVLTTGITAGVIGLVTMPNLIAALHERGARAAEDYLAEMAPFSVFLYIPLAAGYAVFGRPLVDAVLEGPLSPGTVDILWDASRIFLLMGLAWALLAPLTTVALSLQRYRALAAIAAVMIPVHALLVIPAASDGPVTAAGAHAVSGTILVIAIMVMVFGRRTASAGLRAVVACLPAVPLALLFPLVGLVIEPDGLATAIAGLAVAATLYAVLGVWLWRSVGGRSLTLLRAR